MICRQPQIESCTKVCHKLPCSTKAKFRLSVDYAVKVAPTVSCELAWSHTETVLKVATINPFFATWLPFTWINELASWRKGSPLRDITLSGSKFWWRLKKHIDKVKTEADDSVVYFYHSFFLPQHYYTTITCLPIGRAATRSRSRPVLKWLDLALAAACCPATKKTAANTL